MTESLSRADRANAWLQEHLPHHALSGLMHRLTRITWRPFKNTLIRGFSRLYDIDLTEAASADPDAYPNFNAFFTRALRDGARPLAPGETVIASPVDGLIGQIGAIQGTSALATSATRIARAGRSSREVMPAPGNASWLVSVGVRLNRIQRGEATPLKLVPQPGRARSRPCAAANRTGDIELRALDVGTRL